MLADDINSSRENDESFGEVIPKRYLSKEYFPKVIKNNITYKISICFYYPKMPYAEFKYFYENKLVRYEMIIDGFHYKLISSDVITMAIDKEELMLNDLIIEHIVRKNLLSHLSRYFAKREKYGLSDPPDRDLVEMRIEELKYLWEEGFKKHKEEIYPLFEKVISSNPDFVFDWEYIYKETSGDDVMKDIESSDLNRLLWKIHEYLNDCILQEKSLKD
jgi:hypothetical protein